MKLKLLSLLALMLITVSGFSQTEVKKADVKKFEDAQDLLKKNKYEDADKILTDLTEKYPDNGKIWDLAARTKYMIYLKTKNSGVDMILGGNMKVTVKDENGVETDGSDSLSQALIKMLSSMTPSELKKREAINTCRTATLNTTRALNAAILLRNLTVDAVKDTAVSGDAIEQYNLAEDAFGEGNYDKAIKCYKKAIQIEPNYYKARLYLGDAYYMMKDYASAAKYFREAIETFPNELEPRKYLVDALFYMDSYDKATTECKEAIAVYPDAVMFDKMESCAQVKGKSFDRLWMQRGVFPNVIGTKRSEEVKDKVWKPYADAQAKIESYCNDNGAITKSTSFTTAQFAEVYAWEELLKAAPAGNFTTAREMQKKGYLDCYVFISLFHNDLYPQYKEFAAKNKNRILEYLDMLTN